MPSRFLVVLLSFLSGVSPAPADDVGADAANQAFLPTTSLRHEPVGPSPLAAYDLPGPSGVPLGGIGVGCVEFNPLGSFFRNGLNCVHDDYIIRDVPDSFFALWEGDGGRAEAVRLVRDPAAKFGLHGFQHSIYRGVFPTVRLSLGNDGGEPVTRASIYAYSGLVAHDVKDSSLPVIWFEVKLQNPGAARQVSVAFSWQDIIGRQIFDMAAGNLLPVNGNFDKVRIGGPMPRVATFVEPWGVDNFAGFRISTPRPFQPRLATYQNYVQELALLTEKRSDARISFLPAWDERTGVAAWNSFRTRGEFQSAFSRSPLYDPPQPVEKAAALAVKTSLLAGEEKTIRFGLVWYFPPLKSDAVHEGAADHGRYFHNFFGSMADLFRYAADNRERILQETLSLQQPILESTYPEWLQFMILNSDYEIYTNSILNQEGFFTENEGGMGGLAGTVGCRAVSRNFHQRFFPDLDHNDQLRSAVSQDVSGAILHFTGNYYSSLADLNGYTPLPHSAYLDDTPGWISMVDLEYRQNGDKAYLRKMLPMIKRGLAYIRKCYVPGTHVPFGGAAYDDFPRPKIYSYQISVYLSMLTDLQEIADAVEDPGLQAFCRTETPAVREDFIRYLWNGRFFAHGCDADGSHRQDACMFGGQLAGEFNSRVASDGDIVPFDMAQASVIAQFKTAVTHSPEHYPDKRFDLDAGRGMDLPGSRAWPFYLEMYTAMLALQAGYDDDGMALMHDIQNVNLERGFAWTLNLWKPGELTRIDSPVTWYMTDILAGFGVNVPRQTLFLAPTVPAGRENGMKFPVYAQKFWGIVGVDPQKKYLALRVLRNFGDPLVIDTLVSQPAGRPSAEAKTIRIEPFSLKEGAVLDLSSRYDEIVRNVAYPSIMDDPAGTPWKTVKNPYGGADGYDSSLNDLLRVWNGDYRSGSGAPASSAH